MPIQYSHHTDPSVPRFDDSGPRCVMDAQCGLCARGARWIARNDHRGEFGIIPLQSDLGAKLMAHYGVNPVDPASWLYLADGQAYQSADAVIRVAARLGGRWRALSVLRILPPFILNAAYRWIARNRLRISGRADLCNLPDPAVQQRLMR